MKKDALTRILAIGGTILTWLPLLTPLFFGFFALATRGRFLFDFLIPAELFLVELAGGLMLLWAALRAGTQKKLIGWSLAAAVVLLFGSQGLAVMTGLASGEIEPAGVWFTLVLGMFILFDLSLVIVGVGGVLLLRELFRQA